MLRRGLGRGYGGQDCSLMALGKEEHAEIQNLGHSREEGD